MPLCINGALLHATVFGIGAAVGAGVASTVLERKRAATAVPAPAEAATIDTAITRPTTRALQATGGVLRYGHPGEELCSIDTTSQSCTIFYRQRRLFFCILLQETE